MQDYKHLLPPILYDFLRQSPLNRYGWFGDYKNWEEAETHSTGYDADLIVERVFQATLKVKNGEYPYERDSVLFESIQYDWPLLAGLMWVAARNGGTLNVIDYGGSLGSSYWQNRKFLDTLPNLKWNIIEQPKYVERGKKYLENGKLRFYNDLPSCLQENKPNLILLSSVVNYIKDPFQLLNTLSALSVAHMIIERIPFIEGEADRLTVQRVSPKIYDATYPCWFFGKRKFMEFIQKQFNIQEEYDCGIKLNIRSEVKGLILTPKNRQ